MLFWFVLLVPQIWAGIKPYKAELNLKYDNPVLNCTEPLDKNLKFTSNTTFYEDSNKRYVYSNQQVRFECKSPNAMLIGNQLNVCDRNGTTWAFKLPECSGDDSYPPDNEDNTNDRNSCPMGPEKGRPKMWINVNGVSTETKTPISNTTIEFRCEGILQLWPANLKFLYCNNTKWANIEGPPICIVQCSLDDLNELKSLVPFCTRSNRALDCNTTAGQQAGTEMRFRCAKGYTQTGLLPKIKCLWTGRWSANIKELKDVCIHA